MPTTQGPRRDPRSVSDNKCGHQYSKRLYKGYAVCDWCNAVENTPEAAKRCPMAKQDSGQWRRCSRYGGHARGYGPFGSGSRHFEYPEPQEQQLPNRGERC